MRPLRDRLAELIRRSRLGEAAERWPYTALSEDAREDWRKTADEMLRVARFMDIRITST